MTAQKNRLPFQVVVTDPRVMKPDGSMNQFLRGTDESAAYDLVAWPDEPVLIEPGECYPVPLGVNLWINVPGIAGFVYPRSGLGAKKGLIIGNTVGVIDADYQGPAMLYAWNRNLPDSDHNASVLISPGDRIAQIVFAPALPVLFEVVKEFTTTTGRGAGGFGSTGVQHQAIN